MPTASLRALLAQSIDYAGMFPPCSLALEPAVRNQAEYVRSPEAWMLNTFVLSIGQFDAAGESLSLFGREHPLRISALGSKGANRDHFIAGLKIAADKIRSLCAQHAGLVSVDQLETALPGDTDLGLLAKITSILDGFDLQTFWEAPADLAGPTAALLAEHNLATGQRPFGVKLRTGGVTADAFPGSPQIAHVLGAAAKARLPIKFTAGLHHPIRQFRDEVQTKMHGFLNVLGAAVLTAEHGWNEERTAEMLEDEDAASFLFEDGSFAWREWKITTDRIKERRQFVTSFGSCSFDEPCEDLRALNLL